MRENSPILSVGSPSQWGQKPYPQSKKILSVQMDEKEKKKLCYNCDEKLNSNHTRKNPKM